MTCEHYACGGAQSQHYHMVHMLAAISACRFFRNKLGSMGEAVQATPIVPAGELLLWKIAPEDPNAQGIYHSLVPSELGIGDEYDRLQAFLRFSIEVAYYMRLKFEKEPRDLKHDLEVLSTYRQIQVNGANLTAQDLDDKTISQFYQEPVQNAGSFCRSYIRYLLDIALTGYDWSKYRTKIRVEDKGVEVAGKTFYPYIPGPVREPEPGAFNDRWVDIANLTELKDLVETGNPDHIIDHKTLNGILSYDLLDKDIRTRVTEENYPNSIAQIYEDDTAVKLGIVRGFFGGVKNDSRHFFEIYDELYRQCGGKI